MSDTPAKLMPTTCPTCGSHVQMHVPEHEGGTGYYVPCTPSTTSPVGAEWMPISEAPRGGSLFLAAQSGMIFICLSDAPPKGMHFADGAGWKRPGRTWPSYPTHFMPLPPPPEVKP